MISSDGTENLLNSQENIDTLTWLQDLVLNEGVSPQGLTAVDADTMFQAGQLAMYTSGPWNINGLNQLGINYGITAIPAGSDGAYSPEGGCSYMLTAGADDATREAVYKFMAYWLSDGTLKEWSNRNGFPVWSYSVLEDEEIQANEILLDVSEASEIGRDWHLNLSIGSRIDNDVVIPMIEKVLSGEDVAACVQEASISWIALSRNSNLFFRKKKLTEAQKKGAGRLGTPCPLALGAGGIQKGSLFMKNESTGRKKSSSRFHNQKSAYLFIAPSLAILTVFVFVPLFGAFGISLMNIDIYMNDISFAGIKNYLKMFGDARVGNATFHTLYFALLEVPLQVLVALVLVMFMTKNTRFHKLLRTTFYLPYVCSMTAISIMWAMLLNANYGMVPYLLGKVGIQMPNLLASVDWAMPTVILVTVWKGFGYTLTVLSAAALGVSHSLYEAAELDGANGFQKFLYVTIPGIKDTIE